MDPWWTVPGKFSTNSCQTLGNMIYPGWKKGAEGIGNSQGTDGNLYFYVLFEHDAWPAAFKGVQTTHVEGAVITQVNNTYRSTDTYYHNGVMDATPEPYCHNFVCKNDHPCNYRIVTSCIEVQFKTTFSF